MQRNQPLQQVNHNFFTLNRLKPQCHYPLTRVDFNPYPTPKIAVQSILPVYNNDHSYFTPTFLLPYEKSHFTNNSAVQHLKFGEKIKAQIGNQEINNGEPMDIELRSSESKYCQICQIRFEDYWRHISQKSHQRKMNQSQSNIYIQELCSRFERQDHSKNTSIHLLGVEQKKRSKKYNQKPQVSELNATEEVLKLMQGSFSTQILPEGNQLGQI